MGELDKDRLFSGSAQAPHMRESPTLSLAAGQDVWEKWTKYSKLKFCIF